jgi:hypothetical protein
MADRSPEVSVDVDRSAIASTGAPSKVSSRAFDRPIGPAYILDHKFRFMAEQAEDRAVAEIPILFFEKGKLMGDAPHSLGRRM